MWKRFYDNAVKHGWKKQDAAIVVGVSGGPDSVVLLDLLVRFKEYGGPKLHIFHLNHKLRGEESLQDVKFVQELASHYVLPYTIIDFDIASFAKRGGYSIEEAGRIIRHHFLRRISKLHRSHWGALGHTADDQAETFFLHLFRGSGMKGLAGMQTERGNFIIRPILIFTKDEVLAYCKERKLQYRLDSTNFNTEYSRNKIRHQLLPYLEEHFAPNLRQIIVRTMNILEEEDRFLEEESKEVYLSIVQDISGYLCLPVDKLIDLPIALQRRVLRRAIFQVTASLEEVSFSIIEAIRNLLKSQSGSCCKPKECLIVEKSHDFLYFRNDFKKDIPSAKYELLVPGKIFLPDWGCSLETKVQKISEDWYESGLVKQTTLGENIYRVYVDYDKVGALVVARSKEAGDRIRLKGICGHKKLSDIFIDRKIPSAFRERVILLEEGGEIVCVFGVTPPIVAKQAMISPETRQVLAFTIEFGEIAYV